jgi:hypothetical protein
MAWGKKTSNGSKGQKRASAPWEAGIRSKIEKLRKREKWAFRPRHGRTDFYKYLRALYSAWSWTDPEKAARAGRRVAKLYDVKPRVGKTPIQIVIDATCKQDRQVKSRWAQALEYALAMDTPPGTGFIKFLKENGGPEGCKQKMAALRKEGSLRHKGQKNRKTRGW